jgi:hypothetical protein
MDPKVAKITDADRGFTMMFSQTPFLVTSTDWIGAGANVTAIGTIRQTSP